LDAVVNRKVLLVVLVAAAVIALVWSEKNGAAAAGNITEDPGTWPSGDRVWDVCQAIARAEGYNVGPGAAPFDNNNPGDLGPGDEHGFPTIGEAGYHGGSFILHFATAADGWNALYQKMRNVAAGSSSVYSADWSWGQIADVYAGDAADWLRNVTRALGVDPGSSLRDYVGDV
jgi:hypothetical protein